MNSDSSSLFRDWKFKPSPKGSDFKLLTVNAITDNGTFNMEIEFPTALADRLEKELLEAPYVLQKVFEGNADGIKKLLEFENTYKKSVDLVSKIQADHFVSVHPEDPKVEQMRQLIEEGIEQKFNEIIKKLI